MEEGGEIVRLFRAVSQAEFEDIGRVGFRQKPDGSSLESKQFATTAEDAARFGRDNFRLDHTPFHVIEVHVPRFVTDQFERLLLDAKLSVNVSRELLQLLNRHATITDILIPIQ